MTEIDSTKFRVLVCGLDSSCKPLLDACVPEDQRTDLPYDLEKISESDLDPTPLLLLFGTPPSGINLIEVAQVARMKYPNQAIYYLTSSRTAFDRKQFQTNGFTDAFLLPIDTDVAVQTIKDELSRATQGAIRSFRRVQLIDIQPSEKLDFDTFFYMPVNKKYLKMSTAGDELDSKQHEKLTKSGVNSVHVTADQIQKFYDFTGAKLRALHQGEGLSETERKDRMTSAIRNLMASVFNDSSSQATLESGKNILADCQQIVKSFIVSGADQASWYEKMLQATGAESGSHNHSGNVATFGALFSLAIGEGDPEQIALAGLLHDMGIADLPNEVQGKDRNEFTREETEQYQKHVEHTLAIIKFRKMILPDTVIKAVSQHHERWSGTGYPKGHAGSRISIEAQLLALADEFDYLTLTKDGSPRVPPADAFRMIYEENLNHASTAQFDLELLKRFMLVFPEEESVA